MTEHKEHQKEMDNSVQIHLDEADMASLSKCLEQGVSLRTILKRGIEAVCAEQAHKVKGVTGTIQILVALMHSGKIVCFRQSVIAAMSDAAKESALGVNVRGKKLATIALPEGVSPKDVFFVSSKNDAPADMAWDAAIEKAISSGVNLLVPDGCGATVLKTAAVLNICDP